MPRCQIFLYINYELSDANVWTISEALKFSEVCVCLCMCVCVLKNWCRQIKVRLRRAVRQAGQGGSRIGAEASQAEESFEVGGACCRMLFVELNLKFIISWIVLTQFIALVNPSKPNKLNKP